MRFLVDAQLPPALAAFLADTDLRLAQYFGLSDGYWLRAQALYDTQMARQAMAETLARIRPLAARQTTHA